MNNVLLDIRNLVTEFQTEKGLFPAVCNVSLQVKNGEVLGIVGESGSGKTVTLLSVMQLLAGNGRVSSGDILFENKNLLNLNKKQMCEIRGKKISMIFQDPMSALDPVYKCGDQIAEAIRFHEKIPYKEALSRGTALLKHVQIHNPQQYMNAYPHELSGGMCQRIMIAIALSCNPKLLIADEPTTALDVTVQARILDLLKQLREEMNMSIILITHDLGVIVDIADRVAVMYAGEVVEEGSLREIFTYPQHPYTKGLMLSVPRLDQGTARLYCIDGTVPNIDNMPAGCKFCTRCKETDEICVRKHPEMVDIGVNHRVRCWKSAGGMHRE